MKLRMWANLAMTVLLLCQMAWLLIGETTHEWTGTAMFLLFIVHHVLNRRWYGSLFKGKHGPARLLQITVDILLLAAMAGLIISGVMLSRTVFAFLPLDGGMSFARRLHMICSYWGFALMGIHAGFHWNMVLNMFRQRHHRPVGQMEERPADQRAWPAVISRAAALAVCAAGVFSFIRNNIFDYMFLRTEFAFFETGQPLVLFFAQYIAMLGMWICAGHYMIKFLRRR